MDDRLVLDLKCWDRIAELKSGVNHDNEDDFKLGKPPIIEWWIRSTFVPPDDGEPWDWSHVFAFLDKYKEVLPTAERLPNIVPQAEPVIDPDSRNFIFEVAAEPAYFRRRTEDSSKTVQVGEHELVVSHLRKRPGTYPGFNDLFRQFDEFLSDYYRTFQPAAIDKLELHNVDLIVIPERANEKFELTDFLVGAPTLPPEPFGTAFDTDWSISFSCPDPRDIAHVAFSMLPPDGNDVRFRLDWHYWCQKIADEDRNSVADRLQIAHNYLNRCFRTIFTPFVWDLFEPQ